MRGIGANPLMPPIPLCIDVTEDFVPQNEGVRKKITFLIVKVPLSWQQSTTFFSSKYHFVIDEVPFCH